MRLSPYATFAYAIDPSDGLALARLWGEITGQDMRAVVEAVHSDPAWEASFDAIWDCSEVVAHVVRPSEVPGVVSEAVSGQTGRDVLVEREGLAESLFSTMIALTVRVRGKEAHAVRSVDEALGVLGLDALPEALALPPGTA